MKQRGLIVAAAAPAAAILVLGVIYGSLARPLMGVGATMLSSLFIFSGSVQFILAGLLSAGGGPSRGWEMSLALIAGIALLTYGSRALALVFMPDPPARVKAVLDRIPAPLFAALAVTSLIEGGELADPATISAAVFGLLAAPTRSLLWVLVMGLAGYGLGTVIFS